MLCAPNKALSFNTSAPSRGSSAGLLSERSISMWLSLIHWARKNCLANYRKQQNYGKTWKKKKKIPQKISLLPWKLNLCFPLNSTSLQQLFVRSGFSCQNAHPYKKIKKIINLDTVHVQSMQTKCIIMFVLVQYLCICICICTNWKYYITMYITLHYNLWNMLS